MQESPEEKKRILDQKELKKRMNDQFRAIEKRELQRNIKPFSKFKTLDAYEEFGS